MRGGLALGVITALALAGCGGPEAGTEAGAPAGPAESEDFASQLDALCAEGQQRLIDAVDFSIPATSDQQIIMMDGLARTQEQMTPEVEGLTPPADLADAFQEYLALRAKRLAAAQKSAKTGQEDPAVGILTEKMLKAAKGMGLKDCAGVIDPAAKEIVSDMVVADLTSADPKACATNYTDRYLELFWPGKDPAGDCQAERAKAEPAATDVTVDRVTGQGPLATVSVSTKGGPEGDQFAVIALVNADGEWKIHDEYFYSNND